MSASSNKNESGLNVGGEKQGNEKGLWNAEDALGNNTERLNCELLLCGRLRFERHLYVTLCNNTGMIKFHVTKLCA